MEEVKSKIETLNSINNEIESLNTIIEEKIKQDAPYSVIAGLKDQISKLEDTQADLEAELIDKYASIIETKKIPLTCKITIEMDSSDIFDVLDSIMFDSDYNSLPVTEEKLNEVFTKACLESIEKDLPDYIKSIKIL